MAVIHVNWIRGLTDRPLGRVRLRIEGVQISGQAVSSSCLRGGVLIIRTRVGKVHVKLLTSDLDLAMVSFLESMSMFKRHSTGPPSTLHHMLIVTLMSRWADDGPSAFPIHPPLKTKYQQSNKDKSFKQAIHPVFIYVFTPSSLPPISVHISNLKFIFRSIFTTTLSRTSLYRSTTQFLG